MNGRGPAPRVALLRLLGSGLALAGIIVLVAAWLALGTRAIEATVAGGQACLEAVEAEDGTAAVAFSGFPPRAVCTLTVDGASTQTVLAAMSPAVAWPAAAATVTGIAVVVGSFVATARRAGDRDPGALSQGE